MTKYEDIIKQKANKEPIDIDAIARKYNMSVTDVKKITSKLVTSNIHESKNNFNDR